ncbi:hypothetical protein RDI58_003943 [Solanum bulbocastanum]|uniref:Uncharacterized protein n=1 Tax=Solanum bulbocastanum TaxID=147425 RepID=A0AAN8YL20_SOLBU
MLIENDSYVDMGESSSTFNTRPSESENFKFGVDVVGDDDIDVGPIGPDFEKEEVEGSDYSTEDSVESKAELIEDDEGEEYGSDVHEEVRELRAEQGTFQRRKRRERVSGDNVEVPVGEVGPDLGFDKITTCKVSHEGKLGDDEPYFASSDEDSFELDEDECCDDDEHESGRARIVKLSKRGGQQLKKSFMILLQRKLCGSWVWC